MHDVPESMSLYAAPRASHPVPLPEWDSLLPMALIEEIEFGLIVCDAEGQVRFTNACAERELATARVLRRQLGRLRCSTGNSGELDTALRQAALRGRRQLLRLEAGDDRLLGTVLPLQLASAPKPLVLLVLGRRQPCSDLGLELLAVSYGLTLAERRVLGALARQATPREIAAEHAVSMSTVRTQIATIRAKLGARNVEGLLLRMAEVPPVASALRRVGMLGMADTEPGRPMAATAV